MLNRRDLPLARRLLYRAAGPFLYVSGRSIELPAAEVAPPGTSIGSGANLSISVVTPSFNQREFLPRTIASVVNQHYSALEYIVQDGGSTDGSVAVLQDHASALASWESRPDEGQSAAINAGFRRSHGEIMMYLNSDDLLFPGALRYVANYFVTHPNVDVVYSHAVMVDADDRPVLLVILPSHSDGALRWYNFVPQPTLAWRRSLWEKSGSHLDERMHHSMDWDLTNRFLNAGARFARLPTFLAAFRLQPSQKTQGSRQARGQASDVKRRYAGRNVSFAEAAWRSVPHVLRRALVTSAYRLGARQIPFPGEAAPDERHAPRGLGSSTGHG